MTGPRPSLDDIFGAPTTPGRTTATRPSLGQIFGDAQEPPEQPSWWAGVGAAARGAAAGLHETVASTAEKLAKVPTLGRPNPLSRTFAEAGAGGTAMLTPRDPVAQPTFAASKGVSRTLSEIGKYAVPGLGVVGAASWGAAEAFGSTPEESEAGLGASLARSAGAPRLASALETASQTAPGRALISIVLSAVPEVAFSGYRKARDAMRPATGHLAQPSGPIPQPPVSDVLALKPGYVPGDLPAVWHAPRTDLPAWIPDAEFEVLSGRALPPGPPIPSRAEHAIITPPPGGGRITDPSRLLVPENPPRSPFLAARHELEFPAPRTTEPPRRRMAEEVAARRPAFEQAPPAEATPEEMASYLAGQRIGAKGQSVRRRRGASALAHAARQAEAEVRPFEAQIGRIDDPGYYRSLEASASRGGDGYPDGTPRLTIEEAGTEESLRRLIGDRVPADVTQMSDRDIDAALTLREMQQSRDAGASAFLEEMHGIAESGSVARSSAQRKAAEQAARQRGFTNKEIQREGMAESEDLLGAVDRAGYDYETYRDLVQDSKGAQFRKAQRDRTMGRLREEAVRRGLRSGQVAPEVLGALAGGGAGGVTGLATADEDDAHPLLRAALGAGAGALAGAAGGRALGRKAATFRTAAPLANDPDPLLRKAGEGIAMGKRAAASQPGVLSDAERAYTKAISETYPLLVAAEAGGGTASREAMADAIARQQGSGQMAMQYLRDKLAPAIKDLDNSAMERVSALLTYQRDLDLRSRGTAPKTALADAELQQVVQTLSQDPKIVQAADAARAMADDLLTMRRDAGLLSPEQYRAIKDSEDAYIPFLREIADDPGATLPGARRGAFPTSGVRKMDRTVAALETLADPLEVLTMSAQRTFRDVTRQRAQNVLFDLADAGSVSFVTPDLTAAGMPGRNQTAALRNGQRVVYDVDDPDLLRALTPETPQELSVFEKVARGMKEIKSSGITLDPAFAMKNVVRDVAMSGVQRPDIARAAQESGVGAALGALAGSAEGDTGGEQFVNALIGAGLGAGVGLYARPFVETVGAMKSIVQHDDTYKAFLREGANTEGFSVRTPQDAAQVLRQLRGTKGFQPSDIVNPKRWVDALRYVGSVGEQGTRLAAYQQALDAGRTTAQAAREAQDRTLRFANVGSSTKGLAAMTPFWNAKAQGWDKLARMLRDPKTSAMAAAGITAPSVALWSANKDNPEYWERPVWERNLFWLVPKDGGGFYRVPKPFEIGFLFASLPERFLDYAAQTGAEIPGLGEITSAAPVTGEPGQVLARGVADMASNTFEGTLPVPAALALPMQMAQGRDWFRNRDIVTRPGLLPEQQVEPESSALARALAKAGVAPQQTDFAVNDALGTMGRNALSVTNMAARAAGVPAPASSGSVPLVENIPRAFTTSDRGATEIEASAQERIARVRQAERSFEELEASGANEDALRRFVAQHQDELAVAGEIDEHAKALNRLSRARTAVYRDAALSPAQRDEILAAIRDDADAIAREIIAVGARPRATPP